MPGLDDLKSQLECEPGVKPADPELEARSTTAEDSLMIAELRKRAKMRRTAEAGGARRVTHCGMWIEIEEDGRVDAIINFGKHKELQRRVSDFVRDRDGRSYLRWILKTDFEDKNISDLKGIIEVYLEELE